MSKYFLTLRGFMSLLLFAVTLTIYAFGGVRAAVAQRPIPDRTTAKQGCALAPTKPPADREKFFKDLIEAYGGKEFSNPLEVRPTNSSAKYTLEVKYGENIIAGCLVWLRSYNGKIVGDTIRAKPGDTIYLRVVNHLPGVERPHPQDPPPGHARHFSFNITNLHTHGLHTAPQGTKEAEGDNVLLEIPPGESQNYRIHIPENHPSGTFWYHAHVHGATAIQVSSGMAGALIIEGGSDANGGLDTVPVIGANRSGEKIFVLQQFNYGTDGQIEEFTEPAGRNWQGRGVVVNGQLVPVIRMRPGEVQRWRFIHAGVQDNIELSLDEHQLHEIADDGIALGRIVTWPSTEPINGERNPILGPGYRMDVLVQAKPLGPGETKHEYFLRDRALGVGKSVTAAAAALRLAQRRVIASAADILNETLEKPESVIARLVVEGEPVSMSLPSNADLHDRVPSDLVPITADELQAHPDPSGKQRVDFTIAARVCSADGNCLADDCDSGADCKLRYMINGKVYMPDRADRRLMLGTASEWVLKGNLMPHPFHIHTNPFQVDRFEPGPGGKPVKTIIWKDTLLLPPDETEVSIWSRYKDFKGKFVLHCHILGHEDQGMMENVEIY